MDRAALNQLLGERLLALRADEGLTQADFGRRCGMTAAEVCRYERGRRSPHLLQLQRLAAGLGVPIWLLMVTPEPLFQLLRVLRRLPRPRRVVIVRRLLSGRDAPPAG